MTLASLLLFLFLSIFAGIYIRMVLLHAEKDRFARNMARLEPVYRELLDEVRSGRATDTDIRQRVPAREFRYFERHLSNTLSGLELLDASTELRIAEVSGFLDQVHRRVRSRFKWERAIALRTLSYFRDPRNAELFRKIIAEDPFFQCVVAAGMGLAFFKDFESLEATGRRLWEMTSHNQEIIFLMLCLYGRDVCPFVLKALRELPPSTRLRGMLVHFLEMHDYKEASPAIRDLLATKPPYELLGPLLKGLGALSGPEDFDRVLPYLEDQDLNIRMEAMQALARLNPERAAGMLDDQLSDSEWWIRRTAAQSIAQAGAAGIQRLKQIAAEQSGDRQIMALTILNEHEFNRMSEVVT